MPRATIPRRDAEDPSRESIFWNRVLAERGRHFTDEMVVDDHRRSELDWVELCHLFLDKALTPGQYERRLVQVAALVLAAWQNRHAPSERDDSAVLDRRLEEVGDALRSGTVRITSDHLVAGIITADQIVAGSLSSGEQALEEVRRLVGHFTPEVQVNAMPLPEERLVSVIDTRIL